MEQFDFDSQNAAIQRKRELAKALAQQSLTPQEGQMVSGHYVSPGIGGALAPIAKALLSRYANSGADAQQKTFDRDYGKALGTGLDSYLKTRSGAPGETMTDVQAGALMNNDQAPALAEPVKADPRKAIVEAMTSRIPELQKLGQMDMASLGKRPEYKEHMLPDGTLVRTSPDSNTPTNLGNFAKPADKYTDPYTIDGPGGAKLLVRRNLSSNKVEAMDTGAKTTVNVDTRAENETMKAGGKKAPEVLEGARADAIAAQQGLQSAQRIMELAKDPEVITGFAATPVAGLASLATKLGITGADAPAKTQALMSEMANQTLAAVKRLPGAITEKERPFLEMAAAGKLEYTPETIQHLAGIAQQVAHNTTLNAFQQYNSASSFPGADEVAKLYPLPPMSYKLDPAQFEETVKGRVRYKGSPTVTGSPAAKGATPAGVITLDQYLKGGR